MGGHQAIGQQARRLLLEGFGQDAFEGVVVAALLEQGPARDGAIEGVIDEASRGCPSGARHPWRITGARRRVKREKSCVPFWLFWLFGSFGSFWLEPPPHWGPPDAYS